MKQTKRRMTRPSTQSRVTDRRRISAAPGITAPPSETIREDLRVGAGVKGPTKKPKKGANYLPGQQYPPAPAYPLRETPSWTRPDTRTPSPRVKAESPPKKRGCLNFGAKPKEEPPKLEMESQSALDSSIVQSFCNAAPGSPEAPGGTQKRQNKHPNQVRQATYRRKSNALPVRRADTRSRKTSVYAPKDDYCPIDQILPDRIDDDPRPQPLPSRRTSCSIPQQASIPKIFPHDGPRQQYFRRISSGTSPRQSYPQRARHTQKDVPVSTRAHMFQPKPVIEDETPHEIQGSKQEDFQRPVPRDVRRPIEMETPIVKEEAASQKRAQSPEIRKNLSPVPQKEGPSDEGGSDDLWSKMPKVSGSQMLWKQAQGPEEQPTVPIGEQNGTKRQMKVVLEEGPELTDPKVPQEEEDIPARRIIDNACGHSDDDNTWINSMVDLSRSATIPRSSTRNEGGQRRLSRANEEDAPIARANTRCEASGRAPDDPTASQSVRKDPTTATSRPSSSVKRTKARRKSSAIGDDRALMRTATTPSGTGQATSRRSSTAPRTSIQVSREILPDLQGRPTKGDNSVSSSRQGPQGPTSPIAIQPGMPVSQASVPEPGAGRRGRDGLISLTVQCSCGTVSPVPGYKTGDAQTRLQLAKYSLATAQRADGVPEQRIQSSSRPELRNAKPALPRRATSYGMYESSSSDLYVIPKTESRITTALAPWDANANAKSSPATPLTKTKPPLLARRDSLKQRRSPTSMLPERFGQEKVTSLGIGRQQQSHKVPVPTQRPLDITKTGLGFASRGAAKASETDAAVKAPQAQQLQTVRAPTKTAQGGIASPLRGCLRWGWGR
jgi:hypothetical protein